MSDLVKRQPSGPYEFGPFRLDPAKLVLWRGQDVVPLAPKALSLLLALVEQKGDVVSKQDLMSRVWPDTVVEEANLSVTVSALRRALGKREADGPYIETVPRRGYRFIAPVSGPGGRLSLAVLPLRPLGGTTDDVPLGLGMADALISRLTRRGGLVVRSTGTVRMYAEQPADPNRAGAELGVDAVLDGTLQRHGERIRVSVQLVPLIQGLEPWAEVFDEKLTDIFALQDSMAQKVSAALLPRLAAARQPRVRETYAPRIEAYEVLLRGRYFWTRLSAQGLEKAFACFQEAAQKDPRYAEPHAGLAQAWLVLGFSGLLAPEAAWTRAREAAEKALELDSSLADAHIALGYVNLFQSRDWVSARQHLELALELSPDSPATQQWYGLLLAMGGDFEAARDPISRARATDPLAPIANTLAALLHSLAREHERELELCRRVVELDPHQFVGHWSLGLACVYNGLFEEAVDAHGRALELADGALFMKAVLAWTLATTGHRAEAETLLTELDEVAEDGFVSAYQRATIDVALGHTDRAFERLDRACTLRDPWLVLLKVDPMLDPLRSDPRFARLLERDP